MGTTPTPTPLSTKLSKTEVKSLLVEKKQDDEKWLEYLRRFATGATSPSDPSKNL